jgi:nucleotide-binding universal stress UspA family protein
MSSIRRIVVPIDFSDTSREALRLACALAPAAERELHLLHVIPDPFRVPGLESSAGIESYAQVERAWKARAQQQLRSIVADEGLPAAQVITVVLMGHPASLIVGYAEEQRADLIVIGAEGEGAVSRFLLGSVAERVVRHAHVPVLTVPPRRTAAQEPVPAVSSTLLAKAPVPCDD